MKQQAPYSKYQRHQIYKEALNQYEFIKERNRGRKFGLCLCIQQALLSLDSTISVEHSYTNALEFFPELTKYRPSNSEAQKYWFDSNELELSMNRRYKILQEAIEITKSNFFIIIIYQLKKLIGKDEIKYIK